MHSSLTREIAEMIFGLIAGTVLLCWLLNTVFLEWYYMKNKQSILQNGFATINEASMRGTLADSSFDVTFDNLCANGNINVLIISADRTIVRLFHAEIGTLETWTSEEIDTHIALTEKYISAFKDQIKTL